MSSTDHQPWFETPDYQAFVSASIVGDHVVNQQWRSNSLDVSPFRNTTPWSRNNYQSSISSSMDSNTTPEDSGSPLDSYGGLAYQNFSPEYLTTLNDGFSGPNRQFESSNSQFGPLDYSPHNEQIELVFQPTLLDSGKSHARRQSSSSQQASAETDAEYEKQMRRKAQNRASQRAFRLRREAHLKQLEDKLKMRKAEYDELLQSFDYLSREMQDDLLEIGRLRDALSREPSKRL